MPSGFNAHVQRTVGVVQEQKIARRVKRRAPGNFISLQRKGLFRSSQGLSEMAKQIVNRL